MLITVGIYMGKVPVAQILDLISLSVNGRWLALEKQTRLQELSRHNELTLPKNSSPRSAGDNILQHRKEGGSVAWTVGRSIQMPEHR